MGALGAEKLWTQRFVAELDALSIFPAVERECDIGRAFWWVMELAKTDAMGHLTHEEIAELHLKRLRNQLDNSE